MKKIFFLLLFAPVLVKAQFSKGDAFLGGNVSMNYYHSSPSGQQNGTSDRENTNYSYSFSPTIGFFMGERFALGGNIQYGRASSENDTGTSLQKDHATSASLAAVGRYFFPFNEKFSFALTGDIFYSRSKYDSEYSNSIENYYGKSATKSYSAGIHIKPTFLYFPSRHWGFEASIGNLQFVHEHNLSTYSKASTLTTTLGPISLGVAYYFRKS
jgi:outer membrane protein